MMRPRLQQLRLELLWEERGQLLLLKQRMLP